MTASRPRGLFSDGIWYCDCTPRMPAEHFKVKKEGKNQGRWFYTCQQPAEGEKRCGFFLFDEDAKPREASAVLNNSRSERRDSSVQGGGNANRTAQGKMVSFASSAKDVSPSPNPTASYPTLTGANVGLKRNAREAHFGDEDEDEFGLDDQEEEELLQAADTTPFETPNKAQKIGIYSTPATSGKRSPRKLPWLKQQEPATPLSSKKTVVDYFGTSPSKHATTETRSVKATSPETPFMSSALPPAPSSPSPSRYRDALRNPADSQSSITNEVLSELVSIKLPPEKLESLRSILSKHDLRNQGVIKGRNISRLALKAKEARIVELEARVACLQSEKEVDRSIIARLKWRQENGQDEDDEETDDEL